MTKDGARVTLRYVRPHIIIVFRFPLALFHILVHIPHMQAQNIEMYLVCGIDDTTNGNTNELKGPKSCNRSLTTNLQDR
jgi:hypothetical protein